VGLSTVRTPKSPLWIIAPLLGLSLLLGGCGSGAAASTVDSSAGAGSSASAGTNAGTNAGAKAGAGTPSTPSMPRSVPVSVRIPSIGAQSTLVQLGLNPDQTVQLPPVSTPMQAGWYDNSPTPGEIGPAVILGHVDGDHKEGIFFRLHEVKVGDQVMVTRQDGSTATFVVTRTQEIAKSQFPADAVYGATSDAELRLITCGGAFDHAAHSYVDNVIVYAALT
jgi:LPXTG-site transpeptidase (sortase) family protein